MALLKVLAEAQAAAEVAVRRRSSLSARAFMSLLVQVALAVVVGTLRALMV